MPTATITRVRTVLTGVSDLLMHNVQLADPDNYWAKSIAKISSKRKKTEEDRREMGDLEWRGSIYSHEGQIVYPVTNVRMCFREAAKATRRGKDILRAVNATEDNTVFTPLIFADQEASIEELLHNPRYRDITVVTVAARKIPRTRPLFFPWKLSIDWLLITNLLDFDTFRDIVHLAGQIEGIGDNRVNGKGRFKAEVVALD